jgi:hypothetical protein
LLVLKLFLVLLCLFPTLKVAALQSYRATYNLKWHSVPVGTSLHTVQSVGPGVFSAEALSTPILMLLPFRSSEKSRFKIYRHSIRPLFYEYQWQEKKKKKKGEIWFDWQRKKIHETTETHPTNTFALQDAVLDKISLYFQLQSDLKHHKTALDYTVIEPEKIKSYHFKIVGEENLPTPLGVLKTVIVEHVSTNQKKSTRIWFAKDRDFLIVKLQQKKQGKLIAESLIKTYQTTTKIN